MRVRIIRGLLLPAAISAPLVLWVFPIPLRGTSVAKFIDWDVGIADWIWAFVLVVIGLLLVGLPVASFLTGRNLAGFAKAGLLLGVGAVGGCLISILYVSAFGLTSGGLDSDFAANLPGYALFGVLPGLVSALVWIVLNFDELQRREIRDA